MVKNMGNMTVIFNEYYHGMREPVLSVWDLIGPTGILIFTQLLVAIMVFMILKAKRFGRPTVNFKLIKRSENENLYALSNIYIKSKANSIVLENYLNSFKKDLARFLGFTDVPDDDELIKAADENNYLKPFKIKETIGAPSKYLNTGKRSISKLRKIVKAIEIIRKGITK